METFELQSMSAITWLLIGPLFLGRQSGDRLALDIDYNSKFSIPELKFSACKRFKLHADFYLQQCTCNPRCVQYIHKIDLQLLYTYMMIQNFLRIIRSSICLLSYQFVYLIIFVIYLMNELFIRCTDLQTCATLGMNLAGPYSPNAEDLPDETRNGNF